MSMLVEEIANAIQARLLGKGTTEISGLASLESAGPSHMVFVEDAARLEQALGAPAGAIIAAEFAADAKTSKPILIVADPRLAFARAARLLHHPRRQHPGVHSTAVVHHSAKLGKGVSIGPNAVLGEDCVIGEHTRIGPGSCIGNGVVIGEECFIDNNVSIYAGTRVGKRGAIHAGAVLGSEGFGYVRDATTGKYEQFPQIGTLEIGDYVEIGANATIDRGALDSTVIGSGTKIDNLVHIGHNVKVGENVVIAALTGISGSSVIESNVVIGGQVGIGDHARISEGVILGSGSGVLTKKIVRGKGVVFWGRPAKPLRQYLKELATLAGLAKKNN
ncbi:MAG TPA: UDP-3-O-(3-hydroxymyristoyl)glucosamine N-acyltransferase [Terriglobales bacterium]|jgi:UDP-3-O-[3-hydroxymyristoyl] glucosamine N-acyltransferase|nr:UDP-3-O-(3-hydroxymyristoyl)glucosamine N-acyltransferase [Terriglobales bacterium]